MTSYYAFAPPFIFFLIFIWVIFKLLVVWRVMESQTVAQSEFERKRLQRIQLVYLIIWIILWVTQRTFEYLSIEAKSN